MNKTQERERARAPVFVKPSLKEVTEFVREIGSTINPELFVSSYESKGWMMGKGPMTDWRAAVKVWTLREPTFKNGRNGQDEPEPGPFDDIKLTRASRPMPPGYEDQ